MNLPPLPLVPGRHSKKRAKNLLIIGCSVFLLFFLLGIIYFRKIEPALYMTRLNGAFVQTRIIGNCYISYIRDSDSGQKPLASLEDAAAILFSETDFSPSFWYLKSDLVLQEKLIYYEMPQANVHPISFALVINIPEGLLGKQCPILWSRGLQENGTWAKDSPFQGRGGLIAFGDGHVRWGYTLADFQLVDDMGNVVTTLSQLKSLCGADAVVLEDNLEP